MAYIQERKTQDGKTNYRAQVRLKEFPITSVTLERKTDVASTLLQIKIFYLKEVY